MIDCPEVLHSGADLIVSLSVYIRASAFQTPSTSAAATDKALLGLGQETEVEAALRQRKAALLTLFDALNLRPLRDARVVKEAKLSEASPKPRSAKAKITTEIVGDGEEIEVEEGEELSNNELDLIYRK